MAAKKKSASSSNPLAMLTKYNHHLVPSSAGGIAAYALSGLVTIGVVVFAVVWLANLFGHRMHKH